MDGLAPYTQILCRRALASSLAIESIMRIIQLTRQSQLVGNIGYL